MNIHNTRPIWASSDFFKILPNFMVSKLGVIKNTVMIILKGNWLLLNYDVAKLYVGVMEHFTYS